MYQTLTWLRTRCQLYRTINYRRESLVCLILWYSHRPNATILTTGAFITFSFNKASDWLDSLPRAERDKILNDARKQSREAKQKIKDRCLEIERKRFDALKEKQEALRKKRKILTKKKEKQTSDIIYCGL